jgi:hypothetical protein
MSCIPRGDSQSPTSAQQSLIYSISAEEQAALIAFFESNILPSFPFIHPSSLSNLSRDSSPLLLVVLAWSNFEKYRTTHGFEVDFSCVSLMNEAFDLIMKNTPTLETLQAVLLSSAYYFVTGNGILFLHQCT